VSIVGVVDEHNSIGNVSKFVITYGDVLNSPQQGLKVIVVLTAAFTSYLSQTSSQPVPLSSIIPSPSIITGYVLE